jgi:hypothetical protein
MQIRLHRLGTEKEKKFKENFDEIYDFYRIKAKNDGYHSELKFIKERGKIIIYVEFNLND